MVRPSTKSIILLVRAALLLAVFSLVLIGGVYSHGLETQHAHAASESKNISDHAHMEVAPDIDKSNSALHCGAKILQIAQISSIDFVRSPTEILISKSQMGKKLRFGLDPPPPKLYS